MRLIGKPKIEQFVLQHADARNSFGSWVREVERATWSNPHEVRERYRSADFPGDNLAIFNIGGNKYRLITKVYYDRQTVIVTEVATHAEYSKRRIK